MKPAGARKMDYIKIRFSDDFNEISSEFERSFEEIFRSVKPIFSFSERCWKPQMDIYETAEEIIIRAEIAGVDKENLEVEISGKAVRIFGRRSEQPRAGHGTYRLAEIQYGRFERILYLPAPIDTEVVSTAYANGFLQIRMAKIRLDRTLKIPISEG